LVSLLPIIVIIAVFYFLLLRPQRRRQQQQAQMQRQIEPGQRVMTTAGMLAEVVAVEDDAIVLEIAPGVEARFVRQAIGQVLTDDDEPEDELEDEAEDDEEAAAVEGTRRARRGRRAAASDRGPPPTGTRAGWHSAEAEETEAQARETLQDDVEAKTETLPGAAGNKSEDASLSEDDDKSGKRPSA
jgi:preprotein translocase subunit YajC